MHVSDILPTMGRLAGFQLNPSNELNGIDQWDVINSDTSSVRTEVVDFDDVFGYGFYMLFPYKLVDGRVGYSDWLSNEYLGNIFDPNYYPSLVLNSTVSKVLQSIQNKEDYLTAEEIVSLRDASKIICSTRESNPCDTNSLCLFDIQSDQCEENDLSQSRADLMHSLTMKFNRRKMESVQSRRRSSDHDCDPINFHNHWHWWQPNKDF